MSIIKKIIVWILTLESKLIIAKYKPFIVAVTGSVGKTSTKDAIYNVLKNQQKFVRKSEKSLNSDIGLPLTIIGVPNAWRNLGGWIDNMVAGLKLIFRRSEYPDTLVLEVGADHPGDIKRIVKWLRPNIAVITKVSATPVHVEFFESPEQVFEEKAALALGVKKNGTVILLADDDKVLSIKDILAGKNVSILTFGLKASADIRGSDYSVITENKLPAGISFKVNLSGETCDVSLKSIIGQTYMYPLLAAAAVGQARKVSSDEIVRGLNSYEAPPGRMRIISGINKSVIIDDSYNSSPDAAIAALESLKSLAGSNQKIAILGDMMELGKYSAEEHRKIGKFAAHSVSRLITVGQRARATAEEALKNGMAANNVESFDNSNEAAPHVASILKAGDIVLVKGSQSARMERIVKAIMAEPNRAADLLVRQEKEWLDKQ